MRNALLLATLGVGLLVGTACNNNGTTTPLDPADFPFAPDTLRNGTQHVSLWADELYDNLIVVDNLLADLPKDDCVSIAGVPPAQTVFTLTSCGDDGQVSGTMTLGAITSNTATLTFNLTNGPLDSVEPTFTIKGTLTLTISNVGTASEAYRHVGTLHLTAQNSGHPSQTIDLAIDLTFPKTTLESTPPPDPYPTGTVITDLETIDRTNLHINVGMTAGSDKFQVTTNGEHFVFDTGSHNLT